MYGINRAINQKKFNDENHKAVVSFIYISNMIKNNNTDFFKTYKLTPQQFNIMRILRGRNPEPCTVGILKERMLDKMSDASRLVDRLEKMELVKRVENKDDRRAVHVYITQKGLDILAEIDQRQTEFHSTLNVMTEEEVIQLNSLLDKLIDLNLPEVKR